MTSEVNKTNIGYKDLMNFAEKHQPDCSSITDEELVSQLTYQRKSGEVIYYSFNRPSLLSYIVYYPHSFFVSAQRISLLSKVPDIQQQYIEFYKNMIRSILKNLEKISDGLLKFVEQDHPITGIYYNFVETNDLATLGCGGFTINNIGASGKLSRSTVFIPADSKIFSIYAAVHETLHALGFDHLFGNPRIKEKLKETTEGIFCSALPYTYEIETLVSRCQSDCLSNYPMAPGPLDNRLIKLSYDQENFYLTIFLKNAPNSLIIGVYLTYVATGSYAALSKVYDAIINKSPFNTASKKIRGLITDLSFIAAAAAVETDEVIINVLTMLMLVKYIGHNFLNEKLSDNGRRFFFGPWLFTFAYLIALDSNPILMGIRAFPFLGLLNMYLVRVMTSESFENKKNQKPENDSAIVIEVIDENEIPELNAKKRCVSFFSKTNIANVITSKNTDTTHTIRSTAS